jgi:hypothetical protein
LSTFLLKHWMEKLNLPMDLTSSNEFQHSTFFVFSNFLSDCRTLPLLNVLFEVVRSPHWWSCGWVPTNCRVSTCTCFRSTVHYLFLLVKCN